MEIFWCFKKWIEADDVLTDPPETTDFIYYEPRKLRRSCLNSELKVSQNKKMQIGIVFKHLTSINGKVKIRWWQSLCNGG